MTAPHSSRVDAGDWNPSARLSAGTEVPGRPEGKQGSPAHPPTRRCDYAGCPDPGVHVDSAFPQWAFCPQHFAEHCADMHGDPWPKMYGSFAPVFVAPCGTDTAYRRHLRLGTEPCQPCKEAHNEEVRRYARKHRPKAVQAVAPCGTRAAYKRHRAHGEPACIECRKAQAEYDRQRYQQRQQEAS